MRFLLDTNAVIALLNDAEGPVSLRARQHRPSEIGMPAIVLHELYHGAHKSARRERNLATVDALRFEVIDFDREDAQDAGEIRAALALQGTPIGGYDVLIADRHVPGGWSWSHGTCVSSNVCPALSSKTGKPAEAAQCARPG